MITPKLPVAVQKVATSVYQTCHTSISIVETITILPLNICVYTYRDVIAIYLFLCCTVDWDRQTYLTFQFSHQTQFANEKKNFSITFFYNFTYSSIPAVRPRPLTHHLRPNYRCHPLTTPAPTCHSCGTSLLACSTRCTQIYIHTHYLSNNNYAVRPFSETELRLAATAYIYSTSVDEHDKPYSQWYTYMRI